MLKIHVFLFKNMTMTAFGTSQFLWSSAVCCVLLQGNDHLKWTSPSHYSCMTRNGASWD